MEYTIKRANKWIKENKDKVNDFYQGIFHMQPPIGWMNDPNGLVYFNNEFHLYYQLYPYKTEPKFMHWGQFISDDLITYCNGPVILAPTNQEEESGCFSGSALVENDRLNIVYTRHYENENLKTENQYLITSNNGLEFNRKTTPLVDIDSLPSNICRNDFRDPAVYKFENDYYMFVGGKLKEENKGVLLVFKGKSIEHFEYDFMIGPYKEFAEMLECPDYFKCDGKDIFIFSSCNLKQEKNSYYNVNSSLYMSGELDLKNKIYHPDLIKEIDKGDAFYAPKLIVNYDKPIMVAWMEMWGKEIPTIKWNHQWSGAFTFPRNLILKNGIIYQQPIEKIKAYYSSTQNFPLGKLIKRNADILIEGEEDFSLKFISEHSNNLYVEVGKKDGHIYLNTLHSNNMNGFIRCNDDDIKKYNLRILLDSSSIELFINDGKEVISSRIYLESINYKVDLTGTLNTFVVNEIERKTIL